MKLSTPWRSCRGGLALALALSSSGCGADRGPPDHVLLKMRHITQETLLCVPTSAAMVLDYYGDPQDPRRLKLLADGDDAGDLSHFHDFSITLYKDLTKGLQRIGYDWNEADFPNTADGFDSGLQRIESELRQGRPVLVDATLPYGHTFVIAGFDGDRHVLYAVDPNRPAPGTLTIPFETFRSEWNERAYGGDFRAMMSTRPRGQT